MMCRRPPAWISVSLLLGVWISGCQPTRNAKVTRFTITADDELISVSETARTLRLQLDRTRRGVTRLSDSANIVLLFPAAGGAYVNGRNVGETRDLAVYHGTTYVTRRLMKQIGSALRAETPKRPSVRNDPLSNRDRVRGTVLLDAGHGGDDPGAIARTGRREKDVVLAVTLDLAERLRARGVDVKLTRSTDVFVTLDGRVAHANRTSPDLFVSIHADASPNRAARGSTVFVPRREGKHSRSYQAGRPIAAALGKVDFNARGLRTHEKNLRVLERTNCPAVLVELGFLTHPTEEKLLASPEYRQRLANALCTAIVDYLKK